MLEALRPLHPLADVVLQHRSVHKLLTGFIHTLACYLDRVPRPPAADGKVGSQLARLPPLQTPVSFAAEHASLCCGCRIGPEPSHWLHTWPHQGPVRCFAAENSVEKMDASERHTVRCPATGAAAAAGRALQPDGHRDGAPVHGRAQLHVRAAAARHHGAHDAAAVEPGGDAAPAAPGQRPVRRIFCIVCRRRCDMTH